MRLLLTIISSLIIGQTPLAVKSHKAIWKVFPPETRQKAYDVAYCESVGFTDTYNEKSGAKSIFQVIPQNDGRKLYDSRGRYVLTIHYSWLTDSNVMYAVVVAYWMSHGGRNWGEWDCG